LPGHPPALFDLAEPVFLIEDAESVRTHSPQEGVIDRRHDLGRDHGPAIFARKKGRGPGKKFFRPIAFKFQKADKGIVVFPSS
jgi:hypothetical protein